jgi:hypothetical protein
MSERIRLNLLCDRDGALVAREWAQQAAQLYGRCVENPFHFASQADWKSRFERSMHELAMFAENPQTGGQT